MRIKILQVIDQLSRESGVSTVVMNYYRHLDFNKFSIDFMINQLAEPELLKEIKRKKGKIYLMPTLSIKNIFAYPVALKVFFQNHSDYQIVHGHIANAAAFYMKAAKEAGVPIRILHAHNSKGADQFGKRIRNRLLSWQGIRYANVYATCGMEAASYLYPRKISPVWIPNAVEEECYRFQAEVRQKMRKKYGLQNRYVLGNVGRFCPQKNQSYLVNLLEILLNRRRTKKIPHLLFIGNGEEKEKVRKLIQYKKLEYAVTLLEAQEKIADYYQMMDCFLLPSLFEGVPLVGVEAQWNGLPCIFSDHVTKEIASEQVIYLGLDSIHKWAETVEQLEDRKRKNIILPNYQIKKAARFLETFYENCVSNNQN